MKTISLAEFRSRFSLLQKVENFFLDDHVSVYQAQDLELKREVALKLIRHDSTIRHYPSLEKMAALYKIEHGFLMHYFDFLRIEKSEEDAGFDVLVMDFFKVGNLRELNYASLQPSDQRKIVEGIIRGLGVLHENKVAHGDLRPANVFLQQIGHLHPRLSNYGIVATRKYDEAGLHFRKSDLLYLAPEQIQPHNYGRRGKLMLNVDFWSLGMLVYELFTGKYALGEPKGNTSDLLTKVLHADLPQDIDQLPAPYAELVKACLIREAANRPRSTSDLLRLLEGGLTWRKGKVRKKRALEEKPAPLPPPLPDLPPLPDVKCSNCNQSNQGEASTCKFCGTALRGPTSLRNFRRPTSRGFWAMLFITALFVPLGFLYYDFFQHCHGELGNCDLKKWFETIQQSARSESGQIASLALVSVFALGLILAGIFYTLWFARVSTNLRALGALDQRFNWAFILVSLLTVVGGSATLFISTVIGIVLIVLGLILPLFMIQEIWKASNPNYLSISVNWKQSKGSFMVVTWWIISLLFPVMIVLPTVPTSFVGNNYKAWFFLGISLNGLYWLLTMLLILRINRRQLVKFRGMLAGT